MKQWYRCSYPLCTNVMLSTPPLLPDMYGMWYNSIIPYTQTPGSLHYTGVDNWSVQALSFSHNQFGE